MWSFNPAVYLSHAWSKTNSGWGKTSLVLFYVFIWLGILKCTWGVFDPTFLGRTTCYTTGASSEFEENFILGLIRGMCLFTLAFLLYADKGGLHSWNVGFVTFVVLAWLWIARASILTKMDTTMYEECVGGWAGKSVWISTVWILLAFVTILVDERMADRTTEGERVSLNV